MIRLKEERLFRKLKKKKLDVKVFQLDSEDGPDYIISYDMNKMRSNVINQALRSSTLFSNVFYLPQDLLESFEAYEWIKHKQIY